MIRTILVVLLLTCLQYKVNSQDINKDLLAINNAMYSDNYSTVQEFKTYLGNELKETLKTSVYVKGDLYRIQMGEILKINAKKLNLMVDNLSNTIVVSNPENEFNFTRNKQELDSFVSKAESVSFTNVGNNIGRYKITLKNMNEKSVQFEFNLLNYQLKNISIVYNNKEEDEDGIEKVRSVEINYLTFNKEVPISDTFFETSSYITKQGKSFVQTKKYSKFQLVNLINNKN